MLGFLTGLYPVGFEGRIHYTPPSVLAPRLQSVSSQFGSVIDASTKQPLFSAAARRAARQVIKFAADGWLSDPPGVGLYVLRPRDRDNLPLWLCCRGTNSNEGSVHQKLFKNFMSMKGASAELVHFAMVEWVHRHNLRAAHNNRPDFHSIGHSDVWILEDILQLQVEVYGERVSYLSYQAAGDLEVPEFHVGVLPISPDAIISHGLPQGEMLNTLQLVVDGLPEQKMWLAARMGVGVPVLPVHTLPEKLLYFKVQRVLRQKLGGPPTALQVCVEFNRLVGEMYLELVGKAEPVGPNKKLKTPQPDVLSTSRPLATSTPTRCSTTGASTLPTRSSSSCPTRSSSRWRLRTHGTRLSVATPRWHPLCAARFPPTG